jgi:hypothetical protein
MKNSHLLLSLVILSLTVLSARATSLDKSSEVIQLPAYTVEAPRQTAAEKQIARNLDELRAAARTPMAVKVEVPMLKAGPAGREASAPAPVLVVDRS